MKRFARAIAVMLGLAVIGAIVSLVPQKNATAQGGPTVTIASPIPLPVTGSVNATVSGAVAAQQSGNWNVGLAPNAAVGINGTANVNVTNGTLPTQNTGGGAATQVGQAASELVNLLCFTDSCFQVFPDGTQSGSTYSIPSGKDLIITDAQWNALGGFGAAGNYVPESLVVNGHGVTTLWSQQDTLGNAGGQAHLGTGIVVASGSTIRALGGSVHFQGYLVPHQ